MKSAMHRLLEAKLNIYSHETGRLVWICLVFVVIFFVTALFRNYVDTAFIKRYGVDQIPLMLVINGVLTVVVFGLLGRYATRFSDHALLSGFLFLYAIMAGLLFITVKGGLGFSYPILFQLLYLQDSILLVYLWNMAVRLFDARQGKRLFPLITAAQVLGTTVGNFATTPLSSIFGPDVSLLVFAGGCLGTAAYLTQTAGRHLGPPPDPKTEPPRRSVKAAEIPGLIRRYPILRYLMIIGLIPNILLPIFVYQFSVIVNRAFSTEAALISFLGLFRGGMTLGVFLLLLFTGRFYSRIGLTNAALIQPFNFFLVFSALTVKFGVYVATVGQVAIRLAQQAVAGPLNKVLFSVLPAEIAAWSQVFVRGNVVKLGTIVGALVMVGLKPLMPPRYLAIVALVLALYWLLEAIRFRRRFARGLKQAIASRMVDYDAIDASRGSEFGEATLEVSGHPVGRRETTGAADGGPSPGPSPEVALEMLNDRDPAVRAEATALLAQRPDVRAVNRLIGLLDDNETVRHGAIRALADYGPSLRPIIPARLRGASPRVQRGLLEALRSCGCRDFDVRPFVVQLATEAYENLAALQILPEGETSPGVAMLRDCLEEHNREILGLIFHGLWINYNDMRLMYRALSSSGASAAVELIEETVGRELSVYLVPLIDNVPIKDKLSLGGRALPLRRAEGIEFTLCHLASAVDATTRMLTALVMGEYRPTEARYPAAEALMADPDPRVRAVAAYAAKRCLNEDADMPEEIAELGQLERFEIFGGMGVRELAAIASITRRRYFAAGETVIAQGEEVASIFLVVSGAVGIYADFGTDRETLKATIEGGGFIGELSLFTGLPANVACIALERAEVLTIDHHHFQEIMTLHPLIGINLCRYFSLKLRQKTY
jgi:hypothetical protein